MCVLPPSRVGALISLNFKNPDPSVIYSSGELSTGLVLFLHHHSYHCDRRYRDSSSELFGPSRVNLPPSFLPFSLGTRARIQNFRALTAVDQYLRTNVSLSYFSLSLSASFSVYHLLLVINLSSPNSILCNICHCLYTHTNI
jgi:hypothetical protein